LTFRVDRYIGVNEPKEMSKESLNCGLIKPIKPMSERSDTMTILDDR
jgi:hypothetical protein